MHEFTFLRPSLYDGTSSAERLPAVIEYWTRGDPLHCDGEGAESFSAFVARIADFTERLTRLEDEFTTFFVHGRFITCFLWQFIAARGDSPESMKGFLAFGDALLIPNASAYPVYVAGSDLRLGKPWHAPYDASPPLA